MLVNTIPPAAPSSYPPIICIGYGTMGRALVDGFLTEHPADRIVIVNPTPKPYPAGVTALTTIDSIPDAVWAQDPTLVLAVKPDIILEVLAALTPHLTPHTLVATVAAFLPLKAYTDLIPTVPCVRLMPNLGVQLGIGITGGYAHPDLAPHHRALVQALMQPTGAFFWVSTEPELDDVTALFGSGPGYIFQLAADYAKLITARLGMPAFQAQELVQLLMTGSMAYAHKSGLSFEALIHDMIRLKGVTHAGIAALTSAPSLASLLERTTDAALTKLREPKADHGA